MKISCIIPARFDSERFKGKPIAKINGKPMIQHVCENSMKAALVDEVIVATDDRRIYDTVTGFGAECIMTPACRTGTDRVACVSKRTGADIIVNVQGDEPMISAEVIDGVIKALRNSPGASMATAAVKMKNTAGMEDPDIVKVVVDRERYALYFSRSPIPARVKAEKNHRAGYAYLKHVGIYVYRKEFLKIFCGLRKSFLENVEGLEQLRAIENGYRIKVELTDSDCVSVDRESDVKTVERALRKRGEKKN